MAETCGTLFYIGLGDEAACTKTPVAVIDAGTPHEHLLCLDCTKQAHPSRVTPLKGEAGNNHG